MRAVAGSIKRIATLKVRSLIEDQLEDWSRSPPSTGSRALVVERLNKALERVRTGYDLEGAPEAHARYRGSCAAMRGYPWPPANRLSMRSSIPRPAGAARVKPAACAEAPSARGHLHITHNMGREFWLARVDGTDFLSAAFDGEACPSNGSLHVGLVAATRAPRSPG